MKSILNNDNNDNNINDIFKNMTNLSNLINEQSIEIKENYENNINDDENLNDFLKIDDSLSNTILNNDLESETESYYKTDDEDEEEKDNRETMFGQTFKNISTFLNEKIGNKIHLTNILNFFSSDYDTIKKCVIDAENKSNELKDLVEKLDKE